MIVGLLYVNKRNNSQQRQNAPGVKFPDRIMSADYSNSLSRYRSIVNGTFKNIYDRKSVDDTIYDFITDEYGKPESAEEFEKIADEDACAAIKMIYRRSLELCKNILEGSGRVKLNESDIYRTSKDNDKKGLKVGNSAVLLIDDTPTKVVPDHTLICYYGDNISPIIKAVYKISEFDYNIYNPKKNVIDTLVRWEEIGLKNDQIRNALQDILVDTEGVFKKYNRKTHRFNTFAKTVGGNNQAHLRIDASKPNGTGIYRRVSETVSGGERNAYGIKKSVDDTIEDNDLRLAVDDEITDDLFSFDGDLFEEDNTKYLDEYIKTSPQEAVLSMYNSLAKTGESVFRQISTAITNSLDFRH